MVTPRGHVKVMDFGVARRLPQPDMSGSLDETLSALSKEGTTAGTLPYMSPEQLRGEPADQRSDVFSFGIVLYEMVAGRHPFQKLNAMDTAAAILKDIAAPLSAWIGDAPDLLEHIVGKTLAKEPNRRYQVIQDVRTEIQDVIEATAISAANDNAPTPRRDARRQDQRLSPAKPARLIAWFSLVFIMGVLIAAGLIWHFRPVASPSLVRTVIKMEPGHWLAGAFYEIQWPTRTAMAISKNGHFVVYSAIKSDATTQDKPQLYLRHTDQLTATPISGTEGGISPFLSPDDRGIGFYADGKLMKVSIDGGVPVTLCDCGSSAEKGPFGASWGTDNSIVISSDRDAGLSRVSADGGVLEVLTLPDRTQKEYCHRLPHWLPGSSDVLFTIMWTVGDLHPSVALLDVKTREWSVILQDAADARYLPTGHLVFLRQGVLMAVPFDINRLTVSGQPVPVISGVMQSLNVVDPRYGTAAGQFSVSDSGWLVYAAGGIVPDHQDSLVWVDHSGRAQPAVPFKAAFFAPRLSPDGERIAYTTAARESYVWVYDLRRETATPLTSDGAAIFLSWSPDGKRVAFNWVKSGQPNLYWQPADGSGPIERLTTSDYCQLPGAFTPEGRTLAFVEWDPDTRWDIHLLDLRSRCSTPYLNSLPFEGWPEFSPDGRWMAYTSTESGQNEVYVRPFPGSGGKWQVSNGGGWQPIWSREGKQLFYRWRNKQWVVDVRTDGNFSPDKPRLLFEVPEFRETGPVRCWDMSPDGKKFLLVKMEAVRAEPVTEMILVQNWFEELKRLVPRP